MLFRYSEMDVIFYDEGIATERIECIVEFAERGAKLTVKYEDYGQHVFWQGGVRSASDQPLGQGHYYLTCTTLKGRATLHRSLNSRVLEGFWEEGSRRGMWRIRLKKTYTD